MRKILVSACLLGEVVRYDGTQFATDSQLARWQQQGRLVSVCPEVAGGLPVPRSPAEIVGGDGGQVLAGDAQVIVATREPVTDYFLRGAFKALALCEKHQIQLAILKSRSPSCGNEQCYDGGFNRRLVEGQGVTAALLQQHGIRVFSELQLEEAARWLDVPGK